MLRCQNVVVWYPVGKFTGNFFSLKRRVTELGSFVYTAYMSLLFSTVSWTREFYFGNKIKHLLADITLHGPDDRACLRWTEIVHLIWPRVILYFRVFKMDLVIVTPLPDLIYPIWGTGLTKLSFSLHQTC